MLKSDLTDVRNAALDHKSAMEDQKRDQKQALVKTQNLEAQVRQFISDAEQLRKATDKEKYGKRTSSV